MKKMLVSDYDETFYLNDFDIKKNNKEVDKFRNKGNIFVLATGRSYIDFKSVVDKYNIKYDYAIINYGCTILDNNDNIIYNNPIDNDITLKIKNNLDLDEAIIWFCCSKLESRTNFDSKDLTKINIKYKSEDKKRSIEKMIYESFPSLKCFRTSTGALEFISKSEDKSKAIEILIQKLGIDKKFVYTIGNGISDIEMVKKYNGYSIKNSIKKIKEIAIKEYDSVSNLISDIEKAYD